MMADSDEKNSWICDQKYQDLKSIARVALDKEKAEWMKGNAFLMMGVFLEFEEGRKRIKHEQTIIRSVVKKTTIDDFFNHNCSKKTECSPLNKKIMIEFWLRNELNYDDRLKVVICTNRRCGEYWLV